MAGMRIASVGSTATTRWPIDANQAASRPVPAPMSRIGRLLRYQMQDIPVIFRRGNAFVTLEQLFRLVGIALGATDR